MSSYKHKKKKCHRKEIFDLIDDDVDEPWSVQSSDSDNEDINEGKRLTSLVRKSYINHLHEILVKNYEGWKKTVKDIDSTYNIERWAKVLEQKALRSCMVAELYQKTMLHLISDIKRSTQQSKLHISIETVKKLGRLLPVDKGTQSDFETKKAKAISVETQTGKTYASVLDFPLPTCEPAATSPVIRGQPIPTIDQIRDCVAKVTPVPRSNIANDESLSVEANYTPYNPLINFSPCETSEAIKLPSIPSRMDKVEQTLIGSAPAMVPPPNVTSNIDISKILKSISSGKSVHNPPITPLKQLPLPHVSLSDVIDTETIDDILLDLHSEFLNADEVQENKSNNLNSNNKQDPLVGILTEMELDVPLEIKKNSVQDIYNRKRKISIANETESEKHNKMSKQTFKDGLDARLTAMGLLDDSKDKDEISVDAKQKRSNWALEFIAQSCNLTKIMLNLNPSQRKKVIAKFEKLFGLPIEPETELNQENIRICRKRIASVVVSELTPLYQTKRIGSRHLFKFLAKHATTTLMQKSLAPETRLIRRHVDKIFTGGKDIESETDILI